jgi:ribosomal protein L7/L12
MPKEFNCPSCTEPMEFAGGESIFQTCKACHAPVIVPSDILYKNEQKLASEDFATLVNDKPVDVEQVTNELTPGSSLPKDEDSIDAGAKIEKFEVYQEKIGRHVVKTKKAVDEIVAPKKDSDFKTVSPFANADGSISLEIPETQTSQSPINPIIARVKNELQTGDKIEAIKLFRSRFNTSLRDAKETVEAIERGEEIDISQFLNQ